MKKYLFLFLLSGLFAFTSCSSDDDNPGPLVGDWILVSVEPAIIDPSACANNSTIRIRGNGEITSDLYLEQNNCDLTSATGEWSSNGNSSYTLDMGDFLGEVTGTVNFTSTDTFTFTTSTGAVFTFDRQI